MLAVFLTKPRDIYGNLIQSLNSFFCDRQSDEMLNTSYLLNTMESLEIFNWQINFRRFYGDSTPLKSYLKQIMKQNICTSSSIKSESVKHWQSMKTGPNDLDDSTLSFYYCQMFNIYARKIQHSGALMHQYMYV